MSSVAKVRVNAGLPFAALAALCMVLAVGCASSANGGQPKGTGAMVVVTDDSNGKTVNASVGQTVELILSSNYWTVSGSSAPNVVRQDGATTPLPRPTNCPKIPGLGCVPVRTFFKAVTPGTASITASRTACGEAKPCATDQENFKVTVVVR